VHISRYFVRYTRAQKELEIFGFIQPFATRRWPYIYIAFVCIVALTVVLIGQFTDHSEGGARLATIVLAVGAYILSYQQWRAARNEISLDKFYERLDKADQRLENWPNARSMLRHFWGEETNEEWYQKLNYMYVELDNLEYVIEKYKLGYIHPEQALRGLRTFRSRSMAPQFRELLMESINELEDAGYQRTTVEVVLRVCTDAAILRSSTSYVSNLHSILPKTATDTTQVDTRR
jgi:hypothetical protein